MRLFLLFLCMIFFFSCSKSGNDLSSSQSTTTANTNPSTGSSSGSGTGGSGTGGTGSGGSTPTYIVKTCGIDGMAIVANPSKRLMSLSAGTPGTSIELDNSGSNLTLEIVNANSEPTINTYGTGGAYYAKYSNIRHAFPSQIMASDTLTYLTFKIKGFNPTVDGFNQLNLVMFDENVSYNGQTMVANITAATVSTLTNAYLHEVFNNSTQKKLQVIIGP